MDIEKNKDILHQFERLCEREGTKASDVLLWLMDSIVSADRLPIMADDLKDWLLYQEAKTENDLNPSTFTHEKVKRLLVDEQEEEALFYSPENIERLRRGAAALDAGEGVEHDIIEVDDDTDCSDEKMVGDTSII